MANFASLNNRIYVDASATTPERLEVIEEVRKVSTLYWGNSSSIHLEGVKASEVIERSRQLISLELNLNSNYEIIFTSGATESIHLALVGSAELLTPGKIVISTIEHPAVFSAVSSLAVKGWEVVQWPVNKHGVLEMSEADKILSKDTKIVSIIWAQSELGSIQPISEISKLCKGKGILFHTDGTQIINNNRLDFNKLDIDLFSASAHKFCGPKGIGMLIRKRDNCYKLRPVLSGGPQEYGFRSGTQSTSLIAGMAKAFTLLNSQSVDFEGNLIPEKQYVSIITERLREQLLKIPSLEFIGPETNRLSNNITLLASSIKGEPIEGRDIVRIMSEKNIYLSSGSACRSSSTSGSEILAAIGVPPPKRRSGLRLTLGPWLKSDDIYLIARILRQCIESF